MLEKLKIYFVKKNNWQKFLGLTLFFLGILVAGYALAQDFGVEAINTGLDGSLGEENRDPRETIGRIINFALGFLGLIAVGISIYGGFKWMTSGGNEEKISEARKFLLAGVIGLVIILSSWGIATFILSRFSDVVNNDGNSGYNDGDTKNCGCGGYMIFRNGSWGDCIGSDCSGCYGAGCGLSSCDGNTDLAGCQAIEGMCGDGNYCDNNCLCKPKGASGDACNLNINGGVCSPSNNLCGEYLFCSTDSCTCTGSPVITGISPLGGFCENDGNRSCDSNEDCNDSVCNTNTPNGEAGNFLTIFGKNFGEYSSETSKVIFKGSFSDKEAINPSEINPNCLSSWRDDQIVISVPGGVSNGPIQVISGDLSDLSSDNYGPKIPDFYANNIIRPGLCEIDPNRGFLSSVVSYQGINLYSSSAYFGSYSRNVEGLASDFSDATGLVGLAKIPNIKAGVSGSFVSSPLNGNEEKSNYLLFTKEKEVGEGAFISSFFPTSGNAGQYITIFGSGFGSARANSRVYFNNIEAVYDFPEVCLNSVWRNDQIVVKVPAGLEDGQFSIFVYLPEETINTQSINPSTFTFDKNAILKTSICKIDPIRGPTGTKVGLWGEYFGKEKSLAAVKFNAAANNVNANVQKDGRADYLDVVVPQDAITGPVRVIKSGVYGNEMNFFIGECNNNSDCGLQVCCPQGTYKKGQCVNSLNQCFVDVPSSVFEWRFSTDLKDINIVDENQSCAGLSAFYGACFTGGCPNVPGICSPYPGGEKIFAKDCSQDCSTMAGCMIGENSCYYDQNTDSCLQVLSGGKNYNCDLDKAFDLKINEQNLSINAYCNANRHWEIIVPSSCPEGFTRGGGNTCVDLNSDCSICEFGLSCQDVNSVGRCVAPKICPTGSTCNQTSANSGQYKCAIVTGASCDCCCTVGQSERDCCAYEAKDGTLVQLECGGTCGTDISNDDSGFGKCGGCASAGDTSLERDLACNCSDHSGQYCEVGDSKFPSGFCTDCSGLSRDGCLEHVGFCCLDSKGTEDVSDDVCRGGAGDSISSDPSDENFGYCAYYNCSTENPAVCGDTYPVKIGQYSKLSTCNASCPKEDPCSGISDFEACSQEVSGRCCFDFKNNSCSLGEAITDKNKPENNGYCAYYNCNTGDNSCNIENPVKDGVYKNTVDCSRTCGNPISGMGLACNNKNVYFKGSSSYDYCNASICNAPNFACLTESGALGDYNNSDCGICCCQPEDENACKNINEDLTCTPNKGNCKGSDRGLCCGCTNDLSCGSPELVGCGTDTCCEARPNIIASLPEHLSSGVCSNAVLSVSFDQLMNINSVNNDNIILIEEKDKDSVCLGGSLISQADSIEMALNKKSPSLLAKLRNNIASYWNFLMNTFSKTYAQKAFANKPSSDKLYCSVPGDAFISNSIDSSEISFVPRSLLSAGSNYYFVIKGDEDLNSQTGIISAKGVGFNGSGYFDVSAPGGGSYIEGENISFNGTSFKNSAIIKFSTLKAQNQNQNIDICYVDRVEISPESYLFKSTDNAFSSDENDSPSSDTFDTKADRDKVFSLFAVNSDGQILRPVKGYYWDYNFKINDETVVSGESLAGAPANQYFVKANSGITDAETTLRGEISMDRFTGSSCNNETSCVCSVNGCPENCCNVSLGGDGFNFYSNIFVFVCNNPWPNININGTWSPWYDTNNNCNVSDENCGAYNYKFYYCRDAGEPGTADDLPAILNQPIVIGQTSSLVCSSNKNVACSSAGSLCGADSNNDGILDGVCVWNVLKESYFFRDKPIGSAQITAVTDLQTGGAVKLEWISVTAQADAYKVYYSKAGELKFNEYKASDVCQVIGQLYNCETNISGLIDNTPYVFKVSAVSASGVESSDSNQKIIVATDKVPPQTPTGLKVNVNNITKLVEVSWNKNNDDTAFYRLYHSTGRLYTKSFDSSGNNNSLQFLLSQFNPGINNFAISAIDKSNNESKKTNNVVKIF